MNSLNAKKIALLLVLTMISMSLLPFATAYDTDMDGTDDSVDDCDRASGTSSVDRTGCPDRDGDGISDITDGWTTPNPNFQTEYVLTSQNDYRDIDYSPTGEFLVTVEDGTFVRKWNSTTFVNALSVSLGSSNTGTSVAYSPDGNYVAAGLDNDAINIWYADNFTSVNGEISVDVGGGDYVNDVEFSPDSQTLAVTIGRSGNQGTNGQVKIINISSGLQEASYNPSGEDRFYDAAFSPDGSMIAMGGNGDWFIVNTSSGAQAYSNSGPSASVNGIAWSPDGNYIALCIGYDSGSSKIQLMKVGVGSGWTQQWIQTHTTSCYSVDFSPDGSQVVFGFGYYQASGSTAYVYQTDSGLSVDSFDFRPSQGCNSWQGNPCGDFSGVSWHPDGIHIVTTVSRNFEGLYYWYADLDEDNDGYNTTDQGDGIVDAFPTDGTQWDDTDNDGFGDNQAPANQPDACITVWGNSTQDRFGCLDSDGDGYSNEDFGWTINDGADTFPTDGTQWLDTDGDGIGDNNIEGTHYLLTGAQIRYNQTGDAFPNDITQWNDTDGDGWGDNFVNASWMSIRPSEWPGDLVAVANDIDTFPLDRTQWEDTDGDWIGDNELSERPDGCPTIWGDSEFDRLGCLDSDGDGWSNPDANWPARTDCYGADAFPDDATQWCDEDNDGYGSNATGNNADECPNEAGTSTIDRIGCSDRDGDGYSNAGDPFPDDSSQWADRDGDGRGDNPNGSNPDAFPDDTSQWKDTDGDGYGDNPGGLNGDQFWNDAEQWADTDGDGYGDNFIDADGDGISEGLSDVCPLVAGNSNDPATRGCTDTDLDGYTDPVDAFPDDPFQWADSDGDGFGDNQGVPSGDDCVDVFGKSYKNNRHGCPDYDLDGWADVDDAFPEDHEQWADTDGDGWGDNYFFENTTIEDSDYPGVMLIIREQRGDAFPEIADQWSDMDGDGWGDNASSFYQPDAFPLHPSQWNDFDGDGYGDEANYDPDGEEGPLGVIASWQPDGCRKEAGTSIGNPALDLDWGCPDNDNDGIQNSKDPCPWDPEISSGAFGQDCAIKSDPNINSDNKDENSLTANTELLTLMGGAILFLLALIFVAQVSKAAGKKKLIRDRAEEKLVNDAFAEEEERRQTWIEHYVNSGELDKARELGWNGLALPSQVEAEAVPQWKQHEIDQKNEQDAAIPSMMDLDRLL